MSELFRNQHLTLRCSQCGNDFEEPVARLGMSPKLTCPECGLVTQVDAYELKAGLAQVDEAFEDLRRGPKKIR